jgi:hypothetical protein
MTRARDSRSRYVVPRYRAEGEPPYYHVLHGAVPGHQIDFIYCPAVPQGPLTQTHFAHAARLMKYLEPRDGAPFAFAFGNLSRDDVQHEPGHGGLLVLFCDRIQGVTDHAGRAMPPCAHGVILVDRAVDEDALAGAATAISRRFSRGGGGRSIGELYRAYVERMRAGASEAEGLLAEWAAGFDDLPRPGRSALGADFVALGDAPERITILHEDGEAFEVIVSAAARLAAALYRSDVKWTSIGSGREMEIPGGTSILFVQESEARRDAEGLVIHLWELPSDEGEMVAKLRLARPRARGAGKTAGWRERYASAGAGVGERSPHAGRRARWARWSVAVAAGLAAMAGAARLAILERPERAYTAGMTTGSVVSSGAVASSGAVTPSGAVSGAGGELPAGGASGHGRSPGDGKPPDLGRSIEERRSADSRKSVEGGKAGAGGKSGAGGKVGDRKATGGKPTSREPRKEASKVPAPAQDAPEADPTSLPIPAPPDVAPTHPPPEAPASPREADRDEPI